MRNQPEYKNVNLPISIDDLLMARAVSLLRTGATRLVPIVVLGCLCSFTGATGADVVVKVQDFINKNKPSFLNPSTSEPKPFIIITATPAYPAETTQPDTSIASQETAIPQEISTPEIKYYDPLIDTIENMIKSALENQVPLTDLTFKLEGQDEEATLTDNLDQLWQMISQQSRFNSETETNKILYDIIKSLLNENYEGIEEKINNLLKVCPEKYCGALPNLIFLYRSLLTTTPNPDLPSTSPLTTPSPSDIPTQTPPPPTPTQPPPTYTNTPTPSPIPTPPPTPNFFATAEALQKEMRATAEAGATATSVQATVESLQTQIYDELTRVSQPTSTSTPTFTPTITATSTPTPSPAYVRKTPTPYLPLIKRGM